MHGAPPPPPPPPPIQYSRRIQSVHNFTLRCWHGCSIDLFPCRYERKKYHHHRQKARSMPDKYICLIIDGMDQNKTNLPCLRKTSKSTSSLYRLRTHLTGVLDHTRADHGKQVFIFLDILQWPHDSNLTASIINRSLFIHMERSNGQLPPVLYVQMDNTSRENKNKYVLGYFAFLVESGVFRKVG